MRAKGPDAALFVHVTAEGAIYVLPPDGRDGWVTADALDHHVLGANRSDRTILLAETTRSGAADPVLRRVAELGERVELVATEPFEPMPGREGYTSLMQYAAIGAEHLVVDLVERARSHRALDLDAVDGFGYTALQYAAAEGHAGIVSALISAGADPELVNVHGNRALHLAAATGRLEAVRALVEARVDLDATAQLGHTARSAALAGGFDEVVDLLEAARADPTAGPPVDRSPTD